MSGELRTINKDIISKLVLDGDLSGLSPAQKLEYYAYRCNQAGLEPSAKPFDLLKLNGKLVLYANAGCSQQLTQIHSLSHEVTNRELVDGIYCVFVRVKGQDGRSTENMGAVPVEGLKGEAKANAMLKATTKAIRRSVLAHCGLGMLDETEVETIPGAKAEPMPVVPAVPEWTQEEVDDARVQMLTVADMLMDSGIPEDKVKEAVKKASGAIDSGECSYGTFVNRVNNMCERMIASHRKSDAASL
jgi:hypothetical protein